LSASRAPNNWAAPGRFSTTRFQPSASFMALATMRVTISGGVETEAGTMTRILRDG
jgi:hypothetical protein